MWADGIVMPTPALDDDLSLAERIEYLTVQQLVSEPGIEALDVTILPRTSRRDVRRLRADRRDPHLHGLGYELRPVAHPELHSVWP